jgi:hypothetical protein
MSEYTPDAWVIVEMTNKNDKTRKILAGWYGGYIGADEWRLSSGITEIVDKGEHYEIHNESGSVYTCRKAAERFTALTMNLYSRWRNKMSEDMAIEHIQIGVEE